MSLAMIVAVGAIVVGATGAFFSDTETSTGNTFTAGAIDLTVDSEAHYNGFVCGSDGVWADGTGSTGDGEVKTPYVFPGASCNGTWDQTDRGVTHQFFGYQDLKPGDWGENTLSLHVTNNDAYVCAVIDNMVDYENGCTEAEADHDTTCNGTYGDSPEVNNGDGEGELSGELHFFAWDDTNGDNVWEYVAGTNGNPDVEPKLFSNESGPASDVLGDKVYPLYTPAINGALTGGDTTYIGMYWCYGNISVDYANSKLTCDGQAVDNKTQTDAMTADVSFYVEQARHNKSFDCSKLLD